ncbi:(deoxy)nucleoside triphosphate pyrophosphohydrolase [Prosthecobacter sp.]|uniref:(deoxy)nucleoside triphosphate pyrophosphohydrolase n=1 Tax=Prosthecobacter sp. TaxID=1965333 RepID=UPI002ABD0FAE|nr:(deoxy)nucleoside triphosphate pyrophosphohydrolase [Prosthecobacter sp.]MDZ4401028.1 (deoxy)nucleoside triphosphate pyrophosphohydrolase [Prosthecobacter sp.]
MEVKPPVPVVCAIIVRGERIMIAQRPPGKKLGGLWEFPGGKVEAGESSEAALHRELHEELGCTVRITQTLPAFVHAYPWGSIELIPFVCELAAESPEPHPHEHTALAWVERAKLSAYDLAPADVPLLTAWV